MYIPNDCQQIETSRRLYLLHRKVLAALGAQRLELEAEVLRAQAAPVRKSISELGARRWRDAPRRFDVCTGRRRMRAQSVRIGFS